MDEVTLDIMIDHYLNERYELTTVESRIIKWLRYEKKTYVQKCIDYFYRGAHKQTNYSIHQYG